MQHQANSSAASLQKQQQQKKKEKEKEGKKKNWAAVKFNRKVFLLLVIKKMKNE